MLTGTDELEENPQDGRLFSQVDCPQCPVGAPALRYQSAGMHFNIFQTQLEIGSIRSPYFHIGGWSGFKQFTTDNGVVGEKRTSICIVDRIFTCVGKGNFMS